MESIITRGHLIPHSLVVWDAAFLLDSRLAKDLVREGDTLNLHEMAHVYFGDHVTIRHFEHAWLKESWATYLEVPVAGPVFLEILIVWLTV